ncbi:MAG: helix-turn-helix domain-containing protein, partial [Candidatus Dormibacteraceae bacterium]
MNARLVRQGTGETYAEGSFEITTLQDLGSYLQNLRETRRVTQVSLSTRTGALAGRSISRSRISEIENAKRDPVSERELRMYMGGLKCAPHHIDRMVKVLRQCAVTPPKEPPANPVPTHSAISDPDPDRLSSVDDDLTLLKNKTEDHPRTACHDEEERKLRPQEDAPIHLVDASQPQPSRRRGQRYRT